MSFLQEATSNYGVAKPRLWWNQYNTLEGAKLPPPFEITFSALNIKRLVGVRLLLFYYILSKNES